MKSKHGCNGQQLRSKNTPQAEAGFEQGQSFESGETLNWRASRTFLGSWWETSWFKEWERVARREG